MARKQQDERFRSAMQRLSTLTGLEIGPADVEYTEKVKVANDGPNNTYMSQDIPIYMVNAHGEKEIFMKGKKPVLTEMMETIIKIIQASHDVATAP
jgi:hypothetical protein